MRAETPVRIGETGDVPEMPGTLSGLATWSPDEVPGIGAATLFALTVLTASRGAVVLLPHGFDEHPQARYPLAVFHGHFPHTFSDFREEPPDPALPCEDSERFRLEWVSASEGTKFQRVCTEFTDQIRALGPLNLNGKGETSHERV